jgi:hypothetical protein
MRKQREQCNVVVFLLECTSYSNDENFERLLMFVPIKR